jgi:hypothetical protein
VILKRNKAWVLQKGLVPIDAICDMVSTGKTRDDILRRFSMLNNDDIFECIEFYAQNTIVPDHDPESLISLVNTDPEEIIIEVTNINQIVYLKLVELGKRYHPEQQDFHVCMNLGLKVVCLHNVQKIESNATEMQDRLHKAVHQAIHRSVPEVYEDLDRTKEDLDYDDFIKREKNI